MPSRVKMYTYNKTKPNHTHLDYFWKKNMKKEKKNFQIIQNEAYILFCCPILL